MPCSRDDAEALDRSDPLAATRHRFALPPSQIYLDGNSLGPLSRASADAVDRTVREDWGEQLIGSWNSAGWVDLPRHVGRRIAPLIGAGAEDVIATDSTSINLFKLLDAALAIRPDRPVILTETGNFPTDLYITDAVASNHGAARVRRVAAAELPDAIDDSVAVLVLSHVNYRTGARHDMAKVNARARAAGALVLWDLAHSAGAVALDLEATATDLAIGCGYKFLNGGPGAPAFLYVSPALQRLLRNPIAGWFGHAAPFEFGDHYQPAAGIDRWQVGTPSILGLASLHAALEVWDSVDLQMVEAKSAQLFDIVMTWLDGPLASHGFELLTPRQPARRGSQISLRHPQAWPICQALIADGVIGDFRTPDVLRFGLTPLYHRHVDIHDACERLTTIMETGRWRDPAFRTLNRVT
ncbi:kynureninase [uncultured Abyssibacter sp.]|uniref:kynureninase n=1 Tax=uncultured Abyssibacter sp. TaxID=2320202 RepID=UPI0032B21342